MESLDTTGAKLEPPDTTSAIENGSAPSPATSAGSSPPSAAQPAISAPTTSPPDFITGYADYADVLEAPRIFHEVTATEILATALNRNGVTIPLGAVTYSLDLWTVLLSGSGGGRSATIGLADPIIKASQMDLESSVRWGSAEAFYQHFAENPSGLHIWGEMAERLKMLNTPQFSTAKEWLTDRYDSFKVPPPHRYRIKRQFGDTPPIVFPEPPRINILATSADDWFFRNLAEEDSAGGFLPRWLIMRAEDIGREVPIPKQPDASLVAPLAARLTLIGKLSGQADLSSILQDYRVWYGAAKRRFEAQPNRGLALAYWNRHRGHVLKLAVIFEASQTATLSVSTAAWDRAVKLAEQVEGQIFKLLPTGMCAAGHILQRVEERVRQAGPRGLPLSDFTRAFQSMHPKERAQHLKTLEVAGKIRLGSVHTAGRQKTVYIHADFLQGTP